MHLWTQILDFVSFWKIHLSRPEVPDSRRPAPRTHRQPQNPVALGTIWTTIEPIIQ